MKDWYAEVGTVVSGLFVTYGLLKGNSDMFLSSMWNHSIVHYDGLAV